MNEYSVDKLLAYPDVLESMRETGEGRLLTVHLMLQNVCNHRCSFCSYRMPDNKNSSAFNEGAHLAWPDLLWLLNDLEAMAVRGIEVTGGGEPLAYPKARDFWEDLARRPFATALVTNGTLMRDLAPVVTQRMKWARVSIDAGSESTYAAMRGCSTEHYARAWRAVRELRKHAPRDPEFRLGAGFVLSNENLSEVYAFAKRAKEEGADNVRLTCTFSDRNLDYFEDQASLRRAVDESIRAAEDLGDESFRVHNLIPNRVWEIEHPVQDYERCPIKDVLCVVEGEGRVYTCCTFTGSLKGLYGRFQDHPQGFRGLWDEKAEWRRRLRADRYCKNACLYRDRNRAINAVLDGTSPIEAHDHIHSEFV